MDRYDIALGRVFKSENLCNASTVPDPETLLKKIEQYGAENYPELKKRLMLKALGVPALITDSVAGSGKTFSFTSVINSNTEINHFFELWSSRREFRRQNPNV